MIPNIATKLFVQFARLLILISDRIINFFKKHLRGNFDAASCLVQLHKRIFNVASKNRHAFRLYLPDPIKKIFVVFDSLERRIEDAATVSLVFGFSIRRDMSAHS